LIFEGFADFFASSCENKNKSKIVDWQQEAERERERERENSIAPFSLFFLSFGFLFIKKTMNRRIDFLYIEIFLLILSEKKRITRAKLISNRPLHMDIMKKFLTKQSFIRLYSGIFSSKVAHSVT